MDKKTTKARVTRTRTTKPAVKKVEPKDVEEKDQFLVELEKFTAHLNRAPNPQKVVQDANGGYSYIPVSAIEKDLAKVFYGLVQYEIISSEKISDSMVVTARIKVYHPVLKEWMNYDGGGAEIIASEDIVNKGNDRVVSAIKLAYPSAYSEAIKVAAKKIGKRFGSDLNRKYEDNYVSWLKENEDSKKQSQVINS